MVQETNKGLLHDPQDTISCHALSVQRSAAGTCEGVKLEEGVEKLRHHFAQLRCDSLFLCAVKSTLSVLARSFAQESHHRGVAGLPYEFPTRVHPPRYTKRSEERRVGKEGRPRERRT